MDSQLQVICLWMCFNKFLTSDCSYAKLLVKSKTVSVGPHDSNYPCGQHAETRPAQKWAVVCGFSCG